MNFMLRMGVSSFANSSLEWVSQKAAASATVLKDGIRLLVVFGCCFFLVMGVSKCLYDGRVW